MLKVLDVPTNNISNLKKSPTDLFKQAAKAKSGVYIFNRNTPSGVVMSVNDYENMVHKINDLEEKLFDAEVDAHAIDNIKSSTRTYSDEEVRGDNAAKGTIKLDDDDGWE